MCKGKLDPKWVCGFGAIMMVIIIVLSVVISYSGGVGNQVQMEGNGDSALVEESSGLHLLEINESGNGNCAGAGWTWMEIGFAILCFKFVLVITHILHYCWTKKIVKQKVAKNVVVEMARLDRVPPAEQGVVVPALV